MALLVGVQMKGTLIIKTRTKQSQEADGRRALGGRWEQGSEGKGHTIRYEEKQERSPEGKKTEWKFAATSGVGWGNL